MQIFYGSPMDPYKDVKNVNISLKNITKCVRGALHEPGRAAVKVPGRFGEGSGEQLFN